MQGWMISILSLQAKSPQWWFTAPQLSAQEGYLVQVLRFDVNPQFHVLPKLFPMISKTALRC